MEQTQTGAELISAERQRQVDTITLFGDPNGVMRPWEATRAAVWLASQAGVDIQVRVAVSPAISIQLDNLLKHTAGEPVALLTRAGALIAAEIDRLNRLAR